VSIIAVITTCAPEKEIGKRSWWNYTVKGFINQISNGNCEQWWFYVLWRLYIPHSFS